MAAQPEKQPDALLDLLAPPQAVSPDQQAQYEQLLAQGMTPEQAQAQLESPAPADQTAPLEQVYLDQPWLQREATALPQPEQTEAKEAAARSTFEQAMIDAIEDAKARHRKANDAKVAEAAILDNKVKEAREHINKALGEQAEEVEQNATLAAFKKEDVGNHQREELAEATTRGTVLTKDIQNGELIGKQAEVLPGDARDVESRMVGTMDRNNSATNRIMQRLVRRIEGRLERFGIRNITSRRERRQQLKAELANETAAVDRAGGWKDQDISNRTAAERYSNAETTKFLIKGLRNPRRMTKAGRESLSKLSHSNPAAARKLLQAARLSNPSERTFQEVGRAVRDEDLR